MGKEFDMFDDFFKEEDFQIEDEKEIEELELETDDPDDPDLDPVAVPGPDSCDPDDCGCGGPCDGGGIAVDPDCTCDPDDACGCSHGPFDDPPDCDGDPDDCDCDHCDVSGWDTGQKTKWDAGDGGDRNKKDPPPKSVWKQKTWKT